MTFCLREKVELAPMFTIFERVVIKYYHHDKPYYPSNQLHKIVRNSQSQINLIQPINSSFPA